ncbi:ArsR family transcriptional regulator [Reyranella sp.]|uniref:ArsR family transcriptional regulator n=1 Tax=Reyranella sp. TaxID=1929291 RepID=UPI003F72D1EE
MMRVGEIAARDQVSAPAVSQKVKRLVASHGLQVETDGRGRVTAVNVAHYDQLSGQYGDPSKAQAPKTRTTATGTLDDARTRQAYYSSELDRLKLAQQIGKVVLRDDLEYALEEAGDQVARAIDTLTGAADELAAAYEQGGQQALRIKLKDLVRQARELAADALDKMVAAAPETTPVETNEDQAPRA